MQEVTLATTFDKLCHNCAFLAFVCLMSYGIINVFDLLFVSFFITLVFEILLAFSQNKDWKKSFDDIIPARKVTSDDNELTPSHDSVAQSSSPVNADETEEHSSPCQTTSDSPQPILISNCNEEPDVDVTASHPEQSLPDGGDKVSTENSHLDNCTVNVTSA